MADIKKAPYELAYNERTKEIEDSIKSDHRGAPPSREQDTEVRPTKESIQLGEGSHR